MLGEKLVCAATSPTPVHTGIHVYMYTQVQCSPPLLQLLSDMKDFSTEDYHTIA